MIRLLTSAWISVNSSERLMRYCKFFPRRFCSAIKWRTWEDMAVFSSQRVHLIVLCFRNMEISVQRKWRAHGKETNCTSSRRWRIQRNKMLWVIYVGFEFVSIQLLGHCCTKCEFKPVFRFVWCPKKSDLTPHCLMSFIIYSKWVWALIQLLYINVKISILYS